MVVVVSYGPLVGCGCFLEVSRWLLGWLLLFPEGFWMLVVGHNGNVHQLFFSKIKFYIKM